MRIRWVELFLVAILLVTNLFPSIREYESGTGSSMVWYIIIVTPCLLVLPLVIYRQQRLPGLFILLFVVLLSVMGAVLYLARGASFQLAIFLLLIHMTQIALGVAGMVWLYSSRNG
jgi:hypothetical protein